MKIKNEPRFSTKFLAAFTQLVKSLKHYESREAGFGIHQYERFREKYPGHCKTLDSAGFNFPFLGVFIHTHLHKGDTKALYNKVVHMNIQKRNERSPWFIQLMEAEDRLNNMPKTDIKVNLPFESNIESIPDLSRNSGVNRDNHDSHSHSVDSKLNPIYS